MRHKKSETRANTGFCTVRLQYRSNVIQVSMPFDGLMSFADATELWGQNESTLRKASTYHMKIPELSTFLVFLKKVCGLN